MIFEAWTAQLNLWQEQNPQPGMCAVHDFDADGISAAALWSQATGGKLLATNSRQHLPIPEEHYSAVVLLDLSCPDERFPWPQPTLVIDHHPPPKVPPPCLMFNTHDWTPPICTSLMVHQLWWGNDSPRAWIAAVGALSDLGDGAPWPLLQDQIARHGLAKFRQLVSLINSPHRVDGDCTQAVEALLAHDKPAHFLRSKHPGVDYLRECQDRVRRRLNQARNAQPQYWGQLALVEFDSDCSIQAIIAQIWKNRLPDHFVVAANRRSDQSIVQLSGRCRAPLNVIEGAAQFGLTLRGHPRSAGAVLSAKEWQSVKERLCAQDTHAVDGLD